ncbi:RND family transporter [Mycobacteroides salmoniphilum]|uniref:MMPL/RND family transporter n=1 Tax=Mycobacteroides salmoniphilum TaxID=404941 RepID=UPI0010E5AEA3|nr:RND family transporter [Mycobacteroides salmoniphilum]TDZ89794.1 Membrane transport protein mmpL8 [Mycobacteroides salmoniphilum]
MSHGRSTAFARLGSLVVRHGVWVLLGWLLVAGTVNIAFPQLETVVRQQSISVLPHKSTGIQTLSRMADAFDENGIQTVVTVAMGDKDGLGPSQSDLYRRLLDSLHAHPEYFLAVQDLLSNKDTRAQAVSEDGQAWYVMVGLRGAIGSPEAAESLQRAKQITADTFTGSTVTAHVTGPVASLGDTFEAAHSDLAKISLATGVLIAVILLLVYRSLMTASLPLFVIGVSFAVTRGAVSGLGLVGLPISQNAVSFMTAVLLGAGTDYSVFVISRYHEGLRKGLSPAAAVDTALAYTGKVIAASAATVAVTFAIMAFNDLEALSTTGPVCAIAVVVGFAASVTLLPPLLVFAAKHGKGLQRKDITTRHWARVGILAARKPIPTLAASAALLVLLASCAGLVRLSYNDRDNQPVDTDSNLGYALLDQHFPKNLITPQQLLIQSPKDLRNAQSLGDLEQMAQRISQLPGVTAIRGITRPTGVKLQDATLSGQTGKIAEGIDSSLGQVNQNRGQLTELTQGADQLAAGLRQLRDALGAAMPVLTELSSVTDQYQVLVSKLGEAKPAVDRLTSLGPAFDSGIEAVRRAAGAVTPVNDALRATELCTSDPQCARVQENLQALISLQENGFLDGLVSFRDTLVSATGATKLSDLSSALSTSMNRAGKGLNLQTNGGLIAQVKQMVAGINALSDGASQLAGGVHALVDKNLEMAEGMGQIAATLKMMNTEASSPTLSGFYLPQNTFDNTDFKTMAKFFVAKDGKSVRYIIESRLDPYSADGMNLARQVKAVAQQSLPNTSIADADVGVTGFASIYDDLKTTFTADFTRVIVVTVAIVGLILVVLLRSLLAPLYLMATVTLTYLSSLGLAVLVFQILLGKEIFWAVPAMAFIILVAVGADYNMLLISRLREESATNIRVGVIRTVKHTGSVITSAGLIFAASMFGLMSSNLLTITQIGFVIGCGLLLDTFVVRTLTVPAIAVLLGKANWWPAKQQ